VFVGGVDGVEAAGHTVIDMFNLPEKASTAGYQQAWEKSPDKIRNNGLPRISNVRNWLKKRFLP
jgi:hypothetical protein